MDKYLEYINDMLRCDKENRNGHRNSQSADNANYSKTSVENLKISDGKPWKEEPDKVSAFKIMLYIMPQVRHYLSFRIRHAHEIHRPPSRKRPVPYGR